MPGSAILMSAVLTQEIAKGEIDKIFEAGVRIENNAYDKARSLYNDLQDLLNSVVDTLDRFIKSGGGEESQKALEADLKEIKIGEKSYYDLIGDELVVVEKE